METDFWEVINTREIHRLTPLRLNKNVWNIGEIQCLELVHEYKTPLFVLDSDKIKNNCEKINNAFVNYSGGTGVCFAVKAESNPSVVKIIKEFNFGAEVASKEELIVALDANINPKNIVFNGNAKTDSDLTLAIANEIKAIIVDCEDELSHLSNVATSMNKQARFAIRVQPCNSLNATWDMSSLESKFGTPIDAAKALYIRANNEFSDLIPHGIHCHIGSQMVDENLYLDVIDELFDLLMSLKYSGIELNFIDIGGGFPVPSLIWSEYSPQTPYSPNIDELIAEFDVSSFGEKITKKLETLSKKNNVQPPHLIIEPGRFIVMDCGILLTTVQTVKSCLDPEIDFWVSIDAGCHTIPDCWIYDWFFECLPLDTTIYKKPISSYNIAGPLCDSGDILGRKRILPSVKRGDILAFLQVGGYYAHAMQFSFHSLPRAAVVLIEGNSYRLIQPREWFNSQHSFFSNVGSR